MTKLQINVTKDILQQSMWCGEQTTSYSNPAQNCAISLAIRDIFPEAFVEERGIFIDQRSYDKFYSHNMPDIELPTEALAFIKDFDLTSPEDRILMEPISFEIEIPEIVLQTINIDELKPLLENHPTLQLINN